MAESEPKSNTRCNQRALRDVERHDLTPILPKPMPTSGVGFFRFVPSNALQLFSHV